MILALGLVFALILGFALALRSIFAIDEIGLDLWDCSGIGLGLGIRSALGSDLCITIGIGIVLGLIEYWLIMALGLIFALGMILT